VTIREWLSTRSPAPPEPLLERTLELLGPDAEAPDQQAPAVFVEAARRILGDLVGHRRFGRDSALDLLVADALMTFAFEHASGDSMSVTGLASLAARAAGDVGQLAHADA
jgi:hypothetical protein